MRLDDWMPPATALVHARHSIEIAAPPEVVHRHVWDANLAGFTTMLLLGIRRHEPRCA